MEYSIYINQKAAVNWDLSMAESMMFAYLVSSCGWMAALSDDTRFKWASNTKLAEELPLVCEHQGSVRRHMKTLESKELIERRVVGNRSYFRITDKGALWKSDSLPNPNETVQPKTKGERNGTAKANETVGVDPNETVRQSDNQLSDLPNQIKETDIPALVVRHYNEILPELQFCDINRWRKGSARDKLLKQRCAEESACISDVFWENFFDEVRKNDFWMQRKQASDGSYFENCNLEWLLSAKRFHEVVDKRLDREKRQAA